MGYFDEKGRKNEAPKLPVKGDAEAAELLIRVLGCVRCSRRRRSTYARVLQPCHQCKMAVEPNVQVGGWAVSKLLHKLDERDWVMTSVPLATYLAEKTRCPWLVIVWGSSMPSNVNALWYQAMSKMPSSVNAQRLAAEPSTYHVPAWVQALLMLGNFMRVKKLSGAKGKIDWPAVLTFMTENPAARAPLLVIAETCVTKDFEGAPVSFDPHPAAAYLRANHPDLVVR